MATAIITGVAGFIGSHTADLFLEAGHRVVGLDNLRTGRMENLERSLPHCSFSFIKCDIAEGRALHDAIEVYRPDVLLHLAGLVSVSESFDDPELNFRLNLHATHMVAEAGRRFSVRRVVFASSAAVYGSCAEFPLREESPACPISPYGAAKLASETLLLGSAAAYGFVARCQRYFNVYGKRQKADSSYSGVISRFVAARAAGEASVIHGTGEQTRDFIAVRDVARANLLAATHPTLSSGVANICTGRPLSIRDLAALVGASHPHCPAVRTEPARAGDIGRSVGNPDRAARELGFRAEISVEQGLAELLS